MISALLTPAMTDIDNLAVRLKTNGGREAFNVPTAYLADQQDRHLTETTYVRTKILADLSQGKWDVFQHKTSEPSITQLPINVSFYAQALFATRRTWETFVRPTLEPMADVPGELHAFRRTTPEILAHDVPQLFLPKGRALENFTYFKCAINAKQELLNCSGHANFSKFVHLEYSFDSSFLKNWREIENLVIQFVSTLKVDR